MPKAIVLQLQRAHEACDRFHITSGEIAGGLRPSNSSGTPGGGAPSGPQDGIVSWQNFVVSHQLELET
jgi:hypothetical protein